MSYKCKICGFNDVAHQGDVCELCAISADPYTTNNVSKKKMIQLTTQPKELPDTVDDGTNSLSNSKKRRILLKTTSDQDVSDSTLITNNESSNVKVYETGELPKSENNDYSPSADTTTTQDFNSTSNKLPIVSGIVKNVNTDVPKRYFIVKLMQAVFFGIDFPLDDDVTLFQVFPDYTGVSINSRGYSCDQVIVYGKVNAGFLSENNAVDIYGRRDSDNKIIAQKIINTASGTIVKPNRTIGANLIRGVILTILIILIMLII